MNMQEAKDLCSHEPSCAGFTYGGASSNSYWTNHVRLSGTVAQLRSTTSGEQCWRKKARCSSPDTAHGGYDSRTMYRVNAPASCESEIQTRLCNNGAWSSWSGSYDLSFCTPVTTPKATESPAENSSGSRISTAVSLVLLCGLSHWLASVLH